MEHVAVTLRPGTQLGGYEILQPIGVGGMAEIYLARVRGLDGFERRVAIKRMRPELSRSRMYQSMFADEARIAGMLSHPNVVQVFDLGFDGETYYYAMEYVRGLDLRRLLRRCWAHHVPMPPEHAARIAIETAAGLHAAHTAVAADGRPAEIVHRDVSPANILVSLDGCIKLIDFGVARARRRQTETGSGQVKGKVSYLSPEQCRALPIDHRSDVFALGVVLYEMTVGRRLFAAASDYDVLDAIANVRVPLPSAVADGYPLELEAIVMRCLARDPARRYASAQALQLDLEHYALRTALRPSSARLGAWVRDVAKLPAMNVELAIVDTPNDATPVFDASAFVEAARVARPVRAPTLRGW